MSILATAYQSVTASAKPDLKGKAVSEALEELIGLSLKFLIDNCNKIPLQSNVPGKAYFAFQPRGGSEKMSRPVNEALFDARLGAKHLSSTPTVGFTKHEEVGVVFAGMYLS